MLVAGAGPPPAASTSPTRRPEDPLSAVAVVFPGQGAAAPGAGLPWTDHPAWSVVTDAEAVLDRPLARLLLDADADELATTRSSQLAVLLTSLVVWEAVRSSLPQPVAFAGHSLGQITALIASGAVGAARRLPPRRGPRRRQRRIAADAHPGRMAALIGADVETAEEACREVDEAWLANDNAPGQVVIAGTPAGLEAASERARALGVRRVVTLGVGHAFHTPLLADAAQQLAPLLRSTPFTEPTAPVVANTDARPHTDPAGWPDQLSRHLVEPVRWRATQTTLASDLGAAVLVELGPGNRARGPGPPCRPRPPHPLGRHPRRGRRPGRVRRRRSTPDLTSTSKGAP